jgi:pimeloyl-ACP methyl ester carboxylesterase
MNYIFFIFLIIFLLFYVPYFLKTYHLRTIKESDLPTDGSWVKLSKGNIYYQWFVPDKEKANGETIVMVHGFSTPSFVWGGLLGNLTKKGYKVLVYDHFGRGYSERPKIAYSKDMYVESLKELIDSQDLSKPLHLLGYSMGGPIVGHFATTFPELTKSLSLIAPAGFMIKAAGLSGWSTKPIIGDWFWHVFNHKIYGVGKMSETVSSDDPLSINEEEFLSNFNNQLLFKGFTESLLSTVRNFQMFNAEDMYSKIGDQKIPTLVVWGKNDGVVPYEGSFLLRKAIPQVNLITIDEGTHDITYRQPTQVGEAIVNFLSNMEEE